MNRKSFMQRMVFTLILYSFLCFPAPVSGAVSYAEPIDQQPHVLIINAYHRGFGWTDTQTDAIVEAFDASSLNPIYYVEYLDWKRQPYESNLGLQSSLMAYKYRNTSIDLILATDDMGMQFAIDNRDLLAKGAPIVFTGVFEDTALKRMEGVEDITGVYESIDPYGTMEMILELHPDLEHVYLLNDIQESGRDVELEILAAIQFYQKDIGYTYEMLSDYSYAEIEDILEDGKENSVLIAGTHNIDNEGVSIPNEVFVQSLADTIDIPIYSTYDYLFGHGIVGGSLLSGTLQGQKGAQIALSILEGADVNTIDEFTVMTVYYGIDHFYADKNGVDYQVLREPYTVINKPFNPFEAYLTTILTAIGIFLLMGFFIAILIINIRVKNKAQFELELKHQELYETYESLATSEEELKVQNEELLTQQKEIHYLAFYDKLTGLPNRNAVELAVKAMMDEAVKHRTILMVADIDNFNYINTAYGHHFGDELLASVGGKFKALKHPRAYVGRIAGDEFFIMAQADERTPGLVLSAVDDIFRRPFQVQGKAITITKTVGYAIYPDDGETYDDLMIRADMAKKKMKQQGKGMSSRYVSRMNEEFQDHLLLTKALKSALEGEEMYVVYQPQYDVISKKVIGVEALVRWHSPLLGQVSPSDFIPLAEENGVIIDIGHFVMEEVFKFLQEPKSSFDSDFRVSVNISVLQLLRQDFIDRVKTLISRYQVDPNRLEFEITETVLIESFDIVQERLLRLKLMGITIALDDFGTGYSSLTYLEKLPLSTLKIDKAFIDGIILEGEEHFFSKSIIDIAKRMGLRVIAEGVEEQVQVDYLVACGSRIIQGYWYSKPLDEKAAKALCMSPSMENEIRKSDS